MDNPSSFNSIVSTTVAVLNVRCSQDGPANKSGGSGGGGNYGGSPRSGGGPGNEYMEFWISDTSTFNHFFLVVMVVLTGSPPGGTIQVVEVVAQVPLEAMVPLTLPELAVTDTQFQHLLRQVVVNHIKTRITSKPSWTPENWTSTHLR